MYQMRQEILSFTWNAIARLERPITYKSFILESDYSSTVLKTQTVVLGRQIVVKSPN